MFILCADVLSHIFDFCEALRDSLAIRQVCRAWKDVVDRRLFFNIIEMEGIEALKTLWAKFPGRDQIVEIYVDEDALCAYTDSMRIESCVTVRRYRKTATVASTTVDALNCLLSRGPVTLCCTRWHLYMRTSDDNPAIILKQRDWETTPAIDWELCDDHEFTAQTAFVRNFCGNAYVSGAIRVNVCPMLREGNVCYRMDWTKITADGVRVCVWFQSQPSPATSKACQVLVPFQFPVAKLHEFVRLARRCHMDSFSFTLRQQPDCPPYISFAFEDGGNRFCYWIDGQDCK